jgi:hypothetical protein
MTILQPQQGYILSISTPVHNYDTWSSLIRRHRSREKKAFKCTLSSRLGNMLPKYMLQHSCQSVLQSSWWLLMYITVHNFRGVQVSQSLWVRKLLSAKKHDFTYKVQWTWHVNQQKLMVNISYPWNWIPQKFPAIIIIMVYHKSGNFRVMKISESLEKKSLRPSRNTSENYQFLENKLGMEELL